MYKNYIKKPPEDGYVRVYTYEYYDKECKRWLCSNFNWTTPEACLDYLAFPVYNVSRKVISKDILIKDLEENPKMPFVSAYVYEKLGLLWKKR